MTSTKRSISYSLLGAFAAFCVQAVCTSLRGQEAAAVIAQDVDDFSPDRQYAFLRIRRPDPEPKRTCDLIEKDTGKVLLRVAESDEGQDRLGVEVLWSPESKRFALFTSYNHFGSELSVYLRTGDTFRKLTLPDLSVPEIPKRLERGHEWKWTGMNSASADRWRRDGTLVVQAESTLQAINSFMVITSRRTVMLGFSKSGKATILKSTQKVFRHDERD